jgi:hypothetical protein
VAWSKRQKWKGEGRPWKGTGIAIEKEIVVVVVNADAVGVVVTVAATVMEVSEGGEREIKRNKGDHAVQVRHLLAKVLEAPAKNSKIKKLN